MLILTSARPHSACSIGLATEAKVFISVAGIEFCFEPRSDRLWDPEIFYSFGLRGLFCCYKAVGHKVDKTASIYRQVAE
jgi:hypothetical protein